MKIIGGEIGKKSKTKQKHTHTHTKRIYKWIKELKICYSWFKTGLLEGLLLLFQLHFEYLLGVLCVCYSFYFISTFRNTGRLNNNHEGFSIPI